MPQIFKIGSIPFTSGPMRENLSNQSMSILQKDVQLLLEQKSGLPVQEKLFSQKIPPIFHSKFYEVS